MNRFTSRLARFGAAVGGNVVMGAALTAPVLITAAGGAADYHRAQTEQQRMQSALDAAVLAGMHAPNGQEVARAQSVYAANRGPAAASVQFNVGVDQVSGTGALNVPTAFLSVVGMPQLAVRGAARAALAPGSPPCVIVLEPSATAILGNSSSELDASNCPVQVNSTSNTAILINSNSEIRGEAVCVVGGVLRNSNARVVPAATSPCPILADPMVGLAEPTVSSPCADVLSSSPHGVVRLEPGCHRNITIQNNSTVRFEPGVHRITGSVIVNSNSTIEGEGVMLFFQGASARLTVNSSGTVKLSAPSTGTYAGIVMFQSRDAVSASAGPFSLNSSSDTEIEGMIYLPQAELLLNSSSRVTAPYTVLIVRRLTLNSSSEIDVNPNETTLPLPKEWTRLVGIRLAE